MTTKKRHSYDETRKEEHLRLLEQLENLTLIESCCEVCQCDCYSLHDSSNASEQCAIEESSLAAHICDFLDFSDYKDDLVVIEDTNNNNKDKNCSSGDKKNVKNKLKKTKKKKSASTLANINPRLPPTLLVNKETCGTMPKTTASIKQLKSSRQAVNKSLLTEKLFKNYKLKRSKSVGSLRSYSPSSDLSNYNTRDCKILQEFFGSFKVGPTLEITGKNKMKSLLQRQPHEKRQHLSTSDLTLPPWPSLKATANKSNSLGGGLEREERDKHNDVAVNRTGFGPMKLCESMASLCLAPTVRQAFQRVPSHDKKILNRMAIKRSEAVAAKENAWLARKYWENERYERELLKCEQMEEYKLAVRDKQFQDYLLTKARLNEIAQRDLAELQQLREALKEKDERTKRRLNEIRLERGILQCQRRCDELRKYEAVTVQQEEQHQDDIARKHEICARLSERLRRAEQIRGNMLESYLKRVRYDNQLEQLLHEENWRETREIEQHRQRLLKDHISRKRNRSQHFIEGRQRHNEAITKTAKISASLRELVRNSVTPEGALGPSSMTTAAVGSQNIAETMRPLGRLLFDRSK